MKKSKMKKRERIWAFAPAKSIIMIFSGILIFLVITKMEGLSCKSAGPEELFLLEDFPLVLQNPELPTGCEITALTMALNFYGYPADKIDMAETYLPKAESGTYFGSDGREYGNDLNQFFIGDPFTSTDGYTCGIPALITAADQYLKETGSNLKGKDISGASPEELYKIVAGGDPVVVLVTISMEDRRETQGWYTENGEYVEWSRNDHGAVLMGYSDHTVIIADPISGIVEYPRDQFESVYFSRGQHGMILEENIAPGISQ